MIEAGAGPALQELFTVAPTGDGSWLGTSSGGEGKRLFGGQLMAQALAAAEEVVPEGQVAEVLHAQFLREGTTSLPVSYLVEPVHQGRTSSHQRVTASQEGRHLASLTLSFTASVPGLDHGDPAPDVPRPVEGVSTGPRWSSPALPAGSVELQYCDEGARNRVWFRATEQLGDDARVHRRVVAFVTDLYLCDVMLRRHGRTPRSKDVRWGTTDHSTWWHRPLRADGWLLLETWSPSAAAGRGLVLGHVFSEDGALVASLAQQNLARLVERAPRG